MRIRYIFLLLCLWLLLGCGQVFQNDESTDSETYLRTSSTEPINKLEYTPVSLSSATITVLPTIKPTQTSSPTRTATPSITPTATKEIIPFPTPDPNSAIQQQCFPILEESPEGMVLTGTLFLDSEGFEVDPYESNPYSLDLSNGEINPVSDLGGSIPNIFRISPDRKWFFYTEASDDGEGSQLHVQSLDGEEVPVPYWDEKWGRSVKWFDEERLVIFLPSVNKDGSRNWEEYGAVIIFNPFTGEWKKIPPNYPSGLNIDQLVLEFNPSHTKAVYLSGAYYVLWDAQTQTDIWKKRGAFPPYLYTRWSPDGNKFVVIIGKENIIQSDLYLVTRDGQESKLTDLAQAYPAIPNIYVVRWEWSPNGRMIAFLAYVKDSAHEIKGPTLMIVDVATKQVIDTCLIVFDYSGYLVWSPDSEKIVVSSPVDYREYMETAPYGLRQYVKLLLVDISRGYAVQIAEDYAPTGWMLNDPD